MTSLLFILEGRNVRAKKERQSRKGRPCDREGYPKPVQSVPRGALQWMIREPGDYEASLGLAGIKIVELHKFERCWLRRHDSGVMGNRECEEGELRTQGWRSQSFCSRRLIQLVLICFHLMRWPSVIHVNNRRQSRERWEGGAHVCLRGDW